LISALDTENKQKFQYHVNSCYQRYTRQAQRATEKHQKCTTEEKPEAEKNEANVIDPIISRNSENFYLHNLQPKKCKGDTKLYRICVLKRAKQLLGATNYFKDEVNTRCIYLEYPADICS